jgi:hypothetical protein
MKKLLIAFFFVFCGQMASACPDYTLWGDQRYTYTAAELYAPRGHSVIAGGDRNLERCPINWSNWQGRPTGWVIQEPDFSITIQKLSGYQVEFRVVSECDALLVVNTAARNWYYDDDDNGNLDPKIRFTNPSGDGIYDVWVGTYDGETCNAQLIVETF